MSESQNTPSNTPASLAVQILCQQFVNAVQAEQERLAKVAFETDKHDTSAYRFDAFRAEFVPYTAPALVPDAPTPDTP